MNTIQPNRLKLLEAMLRETSQGYGIKGSHPGVFTIPQLRACLSRLDAQIRALKDPVEERLAEGDFEGAYKALRLLEDLVGPDDDSVSGLRWEILDQQVHGPGDVLVDPLTKAEAAAAFVRESGITARPWIDQNDEGTVEIEWKDGPVRLMATFQKDGDSWWAGYDGSDDKSDYYELESQQDAVDFFNEKSQNVIE